ncbi:MAG: hypothetical protein ACRD0A_14920, partial [Acidimicrobiales bacterium]
MQHDEVVDRLRALARQVPDEATTEVHLRRAHAVAERVRHRSRVALAAACVALVAVPAALAVAVAEDRAPSRITPGQVPGEEEFTCAGPPPFAGEVPEGETEEERAASRAAESEAFETWRAANCPEDDEGQGPPTGAPPAGDGCAGPPPFAEVPGEPADPSGGAIPSPRADEATTFAESRAACNDETAPGVPAGSDPPGAGSEPGESEVPPEGVPAGPPEGVPAGPPEGVPAG